MFPLYEIFMFTHCKALKINLKKYSSTRTDQISIFHPLSFPATEDKQNSRSFVSYIFFFKVC